MRKLKLQIQMSLDGFIAGLNGEMDWMVWDWDDELKKYVEEITEPVDCIVLGKNLAQGFIPHWSNIAEDSSHPEYAGGRKYTDTHKVVFTKTPERAEWKNTELAKGDIVQEVSNLKKKNGMDIIAYGGGKFVSSLVKHGLIDEFHLFVNPVAIGKGMPIFAELDINQKFVLEASQNYSCGIAVLRYRVST